MLKSLLLEIGSSYASGAPLRDIITAAVISEFLQSPEMMAAIRRIDGSFLYPAETARLFAGENFIVLAEQNGWIASLSAHKAIGKLVYSAAGPVAICTARPGATSTLEFYRLDNVGHIGPATARTRALGVPDARLCHYGEVCIGDFNNELIHLAGFTEGAVWLRITGPPEAIHTHAFAVPSGEYIYSTFSSHEATGVDFLAKLIKDISLSDDIDIRSDPEELSSALKILESLYDSPLCVDTSRWTVLQAAMELDERSGRRMLTRLAEATSEFSGHAREVLRVLDEKVAV